MYLILNACKFDLLAQQFVATGSGRSVQAVLIHRGREIALPPV